MIDVYGTTVVYMPDLQVHKVFIWLLVPNHAAYVAAVVYGRSPNTQCVYLITDT